jgi:hypothetical protein
MGAVADGRWRSAISCSPASQRQPMLPMAQRYFLFVRIRDGA